ncbi:unnamed protein product, partial [Effrenium voratum]
DNYGYWVETDGYGTFWASEGDISSDLNPELLKEQKDLDDACAAFEDKARTFAQSKTFQRAKGGARGFYPFGKGKGKKGKPKGNFGKGKGYGGWKGSSSSTSTSTTMGKPSNVLVTESALAVNGYTGCFICGDRNHGFRQCPNRASGSGQSSGKGKNVFWNTTVPSAMNGRIYMITEHEEQKVFVGGTDMMMDDPERPGGVVRETAGFGVLDIGATETVGSLEAIEKLCQLRGPHHAKEIKVIPHGQKSFRFGNNQVQRSESYILVPQQIGQQWLQLGIFTLDVGQIPILIGVKTLTKLGAILDVAAHLRANPMATEKNYGKSKGKGKKKMTIVVPPEEKYDSARMQGPDPRDERCVGAPCFGAHIPARPGPGSISGANKFAIWGCCQCGIRLSYTPAFGAHGLTRKAGPVSKDVETALAKEDPEKLKGTVKLKDAEQSLLNQLMKIKERKANLVKQAESSEKHNLEKPKKERMARGQSSSEPSPNVPPETREYIVFSSDPEGGSRGNGRAREEDSGEEGAGPDVSYAGPQSPEGGGDGGGPGVSGALGVMEDEEETSVDFEDVDETPDANYHDVMVNMTEEGKKMVNEQYSHYLSAINEAWSMMGIGENKGGMKVMELCCEENSGLGQAVEAVGGTINRCGLFNNCDIMKRAGYAKVEQLIEKERPDILWLSLPCGATSTIQALNRLTPESGAKSDKKIALARRRATRGISLVEKQIELGGEVLQEWPKENWGWGFASIRHFWKRRHRERRYFEAQVDGCAYGLVMEGEIIKKP